MPKYPCYEATLDVKATHLTVRVWLDITNSPIVLKALEGIAFDIKSYVNSNQDKTMQEIIDHLAKIIPHLNAIQVISPEEDDVKVGFVAYTVSFENDVHG